MADDLKARVRRHREDHPDRSDLADRLLASIELIEREFAGEQRERMLGLAARTFERHLRLVESTRQSRASLAQLEADQRRLRELVDFLGAEPPSRRLH